MPSFHRSTGASFGTGGHGLPAAFCCLRNTAIGAMTFFTAGMYSLSRVTTTGVSGSAESTSAKSG